MMKVYFTCASWGGIASSSPALNEAAITGENAEAQIYLCCSREQQVLFVALISGFGVGWFFLLCY